MNFGAYSPMANRPQSYAWYGSGRQLYSPADLCIMVSLKWSLRSVPWAA